MCWGRRLPSGVESLEVLADLIWIIFSGGDPLNPPNPPRALRGLSKGSCRRGYPRKLEIRYLLNI